MKKMFMLALVLLLPVSFAQQAGDVPKTTMKPLKVSISKSLYLPPDMYGHWSVTLHRISTNAPDVTPQVMHDIWILERENDQVFLSNPVTGAQTAVEVDKVEDNTATFHNMVVRPHYVKYETPTLTVNKDNLSGVMTNQFQRIRRGKVIGSYWGQYRLTAERIGEDRKKFKEQAEVDPELDFEIDEVLPERPSQKPDFQ